MATSKAQIESNIRYNRRRGSITLRPSKEDDQRIRAAADQAGKTVTNYIMDILAREIPGLGQEDKERRAKREADRQAKRQAKRDRMDRERGGA